jgi:glyoxylase-like metal-dependent hydrolase (beta-lactamase superfamily II)
MLAGLDALGIDLDRTDFFITHFHVDHLGLVSDFAKNGTTIYLNRADADRISLPGVQDALAAGFPKEEIDKAFRAHPGARYGPQLPLPFTMPEDGQMISAGGYNLRCVATPGHSFGHLCLYEEEQKVLFSGDHILGEITPNIQAWLDDWNPLNEYLKSLDKTARLDVALVLPGHGRIFTDMMARIAELKEHHGRRAEELLAVLEGGPKTAYQSASGMTWNIVCDSFDRFPVSQKWFATGETIAHLVYLEELGKVRREEAGRNTFVWELRRD